MLPKNKKLRRKRKEIKDEFSQEIESDISNSLKPIERPAEMDDIDFDIFESDEHRHIDEGSQLY
jgi:hypothetical protein